MMQTKERYLVDDEGNRVGVVIGVAEYEKMLDDLEELSAIRAYDLAKAGNDEAIPFEQAVEEIERRRG